MIPFYLFLLEFGFNYDISTFYDLEENYIYICILFKKKMSLFENFLNEKHCTRKLCKLISVSEKMF